MSLRDGVPLRCRFTDRLADRLGVGIKRQYEVGRGEMGLGTLRRRLRGATLCQIPPRLLSDQVQRRVDRRRARQRAQRVAETWPTHGAFLHTRVSFEQFSPAWGEMPVTEFRPCRWG